MNILQNSTYTQQHGISIEATCPSHYAEILSPEALLFLEELHKKFSSRRLHLLKKREERQVQIDQGVFPRFCRKTQDIRDSYWKVSPLPQDLLDRRVEITGPVDRKMIINALNSGANVFMADFEDSSTPSWENCIEGQINLRDAIRGTISYVNPKNNKHYQLNKQTATLMVRPRGWHLEEKHLILDGVPLSASLVDFGLYFFHNAHALLEKSSGPYFYLPKLESHLEARLWNEVFIFSQNYLDIKQGTIKATVLIETILASFEMDEILFELRNHSAGLNCGRWDYIFSFIKKFNKHPDFQLPNRAQVNMEAPCMKAYSQLLIKTCHKRGVHAMGGMAAQIPIKNDPTANKIAMGKVIKDKLREVKDGHDGTWVAHPGLVSLAAEIFDEHMPTPNQIHRKRADVQVKEKDLLAIPEGYISEQGVRQNINVGILYMESWLRGNGAAAIYNLMEDAATAEISRSQVWQWIKHQAKLQDGRTLTLELYQYFLDSEIENIKKMVGLETFEAGKFQQAIQLFDQLVREEKFTEFLTLPAYNML